MLHNDRKVTRGRRSGQRHRQPAGPGSGDQGQERPLPGARQTRAHGPSWSTRTTTPSSASTGPSTGASSSTTCWPGTSHRLYRLHWVMETSLLKTLADKHRSSVSKMARKYKAAIDTPYGPRKCLEARVERNGRKPLVARFGGIPLQTAEGRGHHRPRPGPGHHPPQGAGHPAPGGPVRDLQGHGRASRCTTSARLADLAPAGTAAARVGGADGTGDGARPWWSAASCHDTIHAGQPTPQLTQ